MMVGKIANYYKKMSNPLKASIWFAFCSILQKGISLLSTPIFTRLMTTEQYGVYSVYNSWYSIITILATLNLSAGVYNNAITHYPEDRDEITSSFVGLSTTITLLLFAVYIIFTDMWTDILELEPLLMIIMFIELLFVPAYQFWTVGQRYDYKYVYNNIVSFLIAFASPILGIATVLSTTYKAQARIISYALVQIAVGIFFYQYILRKGRKFYSKQYWKYALTFNLPLVPHYLSMTLLNQSDRIMIGKMVGKSEAAVYSVAYTIAMLMSVISTAINSSYVPYTYRSLKEKNFNGLRKNTNLLLLLVGLLCVVTMAFGPEVIKVFATEEYYDAIWVIPPVSASVYFVFLYPLFSNIEFYFGKTRFVMFASMGGACLNIILNYYFIQAYGYYAAGYTTLICYIIFAFSHYYLQKWIIRKAKIEVNEVYDVKFIIAFSVFVLIAMVGMTLAYRVTIIRYAIIGVIALFAFIKRDFLISKFKEIRKA